MVRQVAAGRLGTTCERWPNAMDWLRQLPLGQYVDGEKGWIRHLDPRIKFAWALAFLITPILATAQWRLSLVALLLLLTVASGLPPRIWYRTLMLLMALSLLVAALSLLLPASRTLPLAAQRPAAEWRDGTDQSLRPQSPPAGAWELLRWGPLQAGPLSIGPLVVNRASVKLAFNSGTLLFTLVHSANLLLLSTPAEELAWTLGWALTPLVRFGLPAEELGFTLLLSLRFLPLVQEEFQNLVRSVATRAVNFRQLGWKASFALLLASGERLLANVLLRADQGADALIARGGHLLSTRLLRPMRDSRSWLNGLALLLLGLLMGLRWQLGWA